MVLNTLNSALSKFSNVTELVKDLSKMSGCRDKEQKTDKREASP